MENATGDPKSKLSKLSAWVPRDLHKQAKMLATATDRDLQELVASALSEYLTRSEAKA